MRFLYKLHITKKRPYNFFKKFNIHALFFHDTDYFKPPKKSHQYAGLQQETKKPLQCSHRRGYALKNCKFTIDRADIRRQFSAPEFLRFDSAL